jgi:DNA mismatch repair protein MLH1
MRIIYVDRLVENSKIKREVKQVYTNIRSNFKPRFVYLSLNVNPSHIDVNIHPTKNEVKLLDGDQIVEKITEVLGNALNEASFSATTKKQKNSPAPLPEVE